MVACVLGTAAPAAAHADLVRSDPPSGQTFAEQPDRVRLTFTEPVDPAFTRVTIRGLANAVISPRSVALLPGDNKTLVVGLPDLVDGPYAVTWTTTTTDGHAASGDMLLGVGSGAQLGDISPAGAVSDAPALRHLSTAARVAWYVGLCLLVGGLIWRGWMGSASAIGVGWLVLLVATTARVGLFVTSLAAAAPASSVGEVIGRLRGTTPGKAWFVLFDVALLAGLLVRRRAYRSLAAAVVAICIAEAATGHAALAPSPVATVAVTAVHLTALSVWGGGLALLAVLLVSAGWREMAPSARRDHLRALLGRFSRAALTAVATLLGTGGVLAWIQLGGLKALTSSDYGQTLLVKLALVAGVIPLGLFHFRANERARRLLARTARVELALVIGIVVVASVLSSRAPGRVGDSNVLAASASPTEARDCREAAIETAECWQRYFSYVVTERGIPDALREVRQASTTDDVVRGECHQLTHTIGRLAFEAVGLKAAQAFTTPLCNSGYPHGAVEAAIATLKPDDLRAQLPTFCTPVQYRPYSFDHHNCAHGVGHGIATHLKTDVFVAAPFCESFADPWETQSCYGGVFMQKVIGDANGSGVDPNRDNPVWPCDIVPGPQKQQCYLISTGRVLRLVDYDYERAFAICDAVEADYVVTCYESMGRDISGISLFKAEGMRDLCLRAGRLGPPPCIRGAVVTTVDEEHGPKNATAFCEVVPDAFRADCFRWRDEALAQL